jgi:hypothetical protein
MTRPRWLLAISFGSLFIFWIAAIRAFLLVASEDPLWLDELHTQWLVSGSGNEVVPRALCWNQTPLYFLLEYMVVHALPEVAGRERLLSVVSVVATGIFLGTFIGRRTGNWMAAAITSVSFGVVAQIPFYATEARPYALLMFVTVVQVAWLIDFLSTRSSPANAKDERIKPTVFEAAVGLILGSALVAIHPTALLILVAELIVLTFWSLRNRNSFGQKVPIGIGLVVLAVAVASGSIWLVFLERTFTQRQLWQGIAEPIQLGVWFIWLLIWTVAPTVVMTMFKKKEIKSTETVSSDQGWLTFAIPMVVVGLMLVVNATQIFPVANIRYAIAVLPVMFVSMGLFLARQSSTVAIICGSVILMGLAFVPTPHWNSNRLVWSTERNWIVDACLGNVRQLRFEHWDEVDAVLGQEIGTGPAVVFLMANVLEDRQLTVGNADSASSPLDDFLFPVASFRSRQLDVEFLPRSTLLGPRFGPDELARLKQPDVKHFVVLRGTDATLKAIQNEIQGALEAENRKVVFNLLGPTLSNVRVWLVKLQ